MGLVGADSIPGQQQAYLFSIVMVPTSSFCEGLKGKLECAILVLKAEKPVVWILVPTLFCLKNNNNKTTQQRS